MPFGLISDSKGFDDICNTLLEKPEKARDHLYFSSVCLKCRTKGESRMMVVPLLNGCQNAVSVFKCSKCGNVEKSLQTSKNACDRGVKITVDCACQEDVQRLVQKGEHASIEIPELGFEMTAGSMGPFTTSVQGILARAAVHLNEMKTMIVGEENADDRKEAFQQFLRKLDEYSLGGSPFTMIIDDISGNSYAVHTAVSAKKKCS
uniref:Zinc finger ZPR1-type domain-containing protein n=2 Tax=Palpitomonas bilix TaxID=652834 RepID=A0A7S3DD09_9EUKA|mmetsp:Transcript_31632/g.82556  ORF Transcript_31632/g.82556 Transcript_31632/m.82556 type:complete len:205 (+) Transcript_31632:691-1305(+)